MASTILRSSEATYEIEFIPSPLRKKIGAHPVVSGGREKRSVHAVPSHSASVRSGGGSTVVAERLARQARLKSAAHGRISEEARSIRSTSGISHRSARASTLGREMRSKPMGGNYSRGGSGHVLAPSIRSRSKLYMSSSHHSQTNRSPAVITLDTSTSYDTPSLTSTSSSFYTSSTPSIRFDPSQFNAAQCDELVEYFLLRFIKRFELQLNSEGQHLDLLEDELANTYRTNCTLPEDQIAAAMDHTYYAHATILGSTLSRVPAQPSALNVDNDALSNNLEIDAVIPPPQDDARAARRAARNQAAAPDGGPGDGDDDDGSDEENNNNNNPGGNGRGNGNGDGNNNPPPPPAPIPPAPPADNNNNAGAGDGNDPPPPGGGADVENEDDDDEEDEDEDGSYAHARIELPLRYNLNNFDYTNECRLVRRAFWLCRIPDHHHGPMMVLGGLTTFAKLANYSQSTWKDVQKAAARWRPSVTLHQFHLDLLAGVSLWILVKIVLSVTRNASLLTKEELARITAREICANDEDPDSKLLRLKNIKQFAQWKKAMVAFLDTKRSKDGL